MELMELKEKTTLSREEAAARLHAIADELAANNDVVIEREDIQFVAQVLQLLSGNSADVGIANRSA